jgi:hypothetical protein
VGEEVYLTFRTDKRMYLKRCLLPWMSKLLLTTFVGLLKWDNYDKVVVQTLKSSFISSYCDVTVYLVVLVFDFCLSSLPSAVASGLARTSSKQLCLCWDHFLVIVLCSYNPLRKLFQSSPNTANFN